MAPATQLCSTNRTMSRVGRIDAYIKGACEHLNSLTEDVCMTPNQDMREQGLQRLKAIEADILEVERDITHFQSAYQTTADCVKLMMDRDGTEESDVNASSILEDHLQVLRDNIEPIRNTDRFRRYEDFIVDFQRKAAQPPPPHSEPERPATLNSSQNDMVLTSADVQTHCPYTGRVMTDPVKNLICGHIYDRIGINELMKKASKKGPKCPVSMCRNNKEVLPQHIVADPILKSKIIKMNLL